MIFVLFIDQEMNSKEENQYMQKSNHTKKENSLEDFVEYTNFSIKEPNFR